MPLIFWQNQIVEKKRVIGFAIFALALAGALSWFISRSREPEYDGKSLGYWLNKYAEYNTSETSVQEADHAIEGIGTNALPFLLQQLKKGDSPIGDKIVALANRQNLFKLGWETRTARIHKVSRAFGVLRNNARGSIPELLEIYRKNFGTNSRMGAMVALAAIGPAAKETVPVLTNFLAHAPRELQSTIAYTLGSIHEHPEQAIPALIGCATNPPPDYPQVFAWAFSKFGTNAASALPLLQQWSTNSDRALSHYSKIAITKIEPDSSSHGTRNTD